ncbi:MAG: hypothetical protein GY721_02035 [Deltaproteobacteria bacterium]|nr:hypothetical protein [Deltaproteobacteria bacterium]
MIERVETHLATCPQCAQEYDDLLETVEMVRPSELLPASPDL